MEEVEGLGGGGVGGGGTGWRCRWRRWRRSYGRDLALDEVQQLLLAAAEEGVLELSVLLLRLQQPPLLHVHHLPEAVCSQDTCEGHRTHVRITGHM